MRATMNPQARPAVSQPAFGIPPRRIAQGGSDAVNQTGVPSQTNHTGQRRIRQPDVQQRLHHRRHRHPRTPAEAKILKILLTRYFRWLAWSTAGAGRMTVPVRWWRRSWGERFAIGAASKRAKLSFAFPALVAGLIGVWERCWASVSICAAVRALVFILGSLGPGVGDADEMPKSRHSAGQSAGHGAAIADRRAKGVRLGQRANCPRVRVVGVRPLAATKWIAVLRQNSSWVVRGFMRASTALRWLQTAHGIKREPLLSR